VVIIDDGTGLLKLMNPVIVEASGEQQELEAASVFRDLRKG
jgi:hypothetical protein